jgi:1-hydroxycarotenoid 3,4-desaturase
MPAERVVIVGAGVGGLAAAMLLAARGLDVTVVERAATVGGKLRTLGVGGRPADAGPTVFTMAWVFQELFDQAGSDINDHLTLHAATTLARHAWPDGSRLDLFADISASAEAIASFAGNSEARGYREFCARAEKMFATLRDSFLTAEQPSQAGLVKRAGIAGIAAFLRTPPFATLWSALGEHFRDPRLRQLFGRYATYVGSSPFATPATMMLIAHVEQDGVWFVEGGMHRIARAMADVAAGHGARIRTEAEVAAIEVTQGRASGVRLAGGERIDADAVIANCDAAAIGAGLFGRDVAHAVEPTPPGERSLSAMTWTMAAHARGFPLLRHSVFFSADYEAEFRTIFRDRRLPGNPTIYVCAQDRGDEDGPAMHAPERLLVLVNAPPVGDTGPLPESEVRRCEQTTFEALARMGLSVTPEATIRTTPHEWEKLFPATGGALYGRAVHGAMATFRRPGNRTKLPGLYLAGGSVHPGAGVPTATLSGRIAASSLLADLPSAQSSAQSSANASTGTSRRAAMPGGTSTR